MAVTIAKKPVVAPPAKPANAYAPQQAVAAPVANPANPPAAVAEEQDEDDEKPAKEPRKKRSDFATWEEFCDYKIANYKAMLERTTAKVTLWEQKKVNKDADLAEKQQKKADKLVAAWIAVQRKLGTPEEVIQEKVKLFGMQ